MGKHKHVAEMAVQLLVSRATRGRQDTHGDTAGSASWHLTSDAQGKKVLMHEEASLKYIRITILASEYANRIPLGRRSGKVCTGGMLLVLQPLAAVLSMQLDCQSFSEVVPALNRGLYGCRILSTSYFALQTCSCSAALLMYA